jgi:hypothetical protein
MIMEESTLTTRPNVARRSCKIDSPCAICLQFSPAAGDSSSSSSTLLASLISDEGTPQDLNQVNQGRVGMAVEEADANGEAGRGIGPSR